jgi:hypothetical protein
MKPTAVAAAIGLPAYSTSSFCLRNSLMFLSLGSAYNQAPAFLGSSCAHAISAFLNYLSSEIISLNGNGQ